MRLSYLIVINLSHWRNGTSMRDEFFFLIILTHLLPMYQSNLYPLIPLFYVCRLLYIHVFLGTLVILVTCFIVLTELPLPKPKEPTGKKKSLLFSPRVADEARRVLATADPNIVSQMAHVLKQTNVDHM